MGLPDDYRLPANVNEALALAGDGVVVPVVRFWRSTSSSLFWGLSAELMPQGEPSHDYSRLQPRPVRALEAAASKDLRRPLRSRREPARCPGVRRRANCDERPRDAAHALRTQPP